MAKIKLAIMASGSGSNAEAIMNWAASSPLAEVVCVVSDKKKAGVISRAEKYQIPCFRVLKKKDESKVEFDQRIIMRLADYNPDWILLAGFMRILSPEFLKAFNDRVINIHPSLLPLFPGIDGYSDAFKADVVESGCTIHYVDEGIDTGKIIAQKKFAKIPGESLEDFKKRGLALENQFYPETLEKLLKGLL